MHDTGITFRNIVYHKLVKHYIGKNNLRNNSDQCIPHHSLNQQILHFPCNTMQVENIAILQCYTETMMTIHIWDMLLAGTGTGKCTDANVVAVTLLIIPGIKTIMADVLFLI